MRHRNHSSEPIAKIGKIFIERSRFGSEVSYLVGEQYDDGDFIRGIYKRTLKEAKALAEILNQPRETQ